jgi:hypothetical protein
MKARARRQNLCFREKIMEIVLAIATIFSILWLMVVQFFARIILFSGGGVSKTWNGLVVLVSVVVGFGPLALIFYYFMGG